MGIKRETGESYISFAQRVTNAVEDGLIGYEEWSTALLGGVRYRIMDSGTAPTGVFKYR